VQLTFIPGGNVLNTMNKWHKVTAGRKQKNRKYHQQTFKWLSYLLQSKYWTQTNISVTVTWWWI